MTDTRLPERIRAYYQSCRERGQDHEKAAGNTAHRFMQPLAVVFRNLTGHDVPVTLPKVT